MGTVTSVVILMFELTAFNAVSRFVLQDWGRADAETVRLTPSAVPGTPPAVREELDRRGCRIPQSYSNKTSHNVIRGRFTSSSQRDVAVLCSKDRVSSILVFRGGSAGLVEELASGPDRDYLQVVGSGGVVGYSRRLGVADAKYIREHHERDGGPEPPRLDHDGINDIFVGKGSIVWYFFGGRWLQLTGAD
jgi:hypothetical protein